MPTTLTILFTIAYAYYDHNKYFVDHSSRVVVRGAFFAILAGITTYNSGTISIIEFLKAGFLYVAIFYMIFDYAHNLFKGMPWNYIGGTSDLDKIKKEIEKQIPNFDLFTKIVLLAIAVCIQFISMSTIILLALTAVLAAVAWFLTTSIFKIPKKEWFSIFIYVIEAVIIGGFVFQYLG